MKSVVTKRRINRVIQKIDGLAGQLEALGDELPAPSPAEVEEMIAGRRPFTYEALLHGLLACIHFHLTEATVSLWVEGYSRYTPSMFNGQITDWHIVQGLTNRAREMAERKARELPEELHHAIQEN